MSIDEPKPFGMWTRNHIRVDPRWTKHFSPITLDSYLQADDFPKLTGLRMGGQYIYDASEVDQFFKAVEVYVAGVAERAAAKRRASEEAFQARLARDRRDAKWVEEQQALYRQCEAKNRDRMEAIARANPPVPQPWLG